MNTSMLASYKKNMRKLIKGLMKGESEKLSMPPSPPLVFSVTGGMERDFNNQNATSFPACHQVGSAILLYSESEVPGQEVAML